MSHIGLALEKAGSYVGDLAEQFLDEKKQKLTTIARKEHSSAIALAAVTSVLMYVIGVSSDSMVVGEFCCLYQTGADIRAGCAFNRCVSDVTGFSVNIGLFDGNIMDMDITVCGADGDDASYPPTDAAICGHIRTVRAFAILAILAGLGAAVLAVLVYCKEIGHGWRSRLAIKAVVTLAVSCLCGLIAYSVWQDKVNDQLSAMIEDDFITNWPGGRQGNQVRYFRTIGYSYGALLTGWVFSLMFLIAELVLPNQPREIAAIF